MATLFIDSGNSRLKWRYRGREGSELQSEQPRIPKALRLVRPSSVSIAAVRRSLLAEDIARHFDSRGIRVRWARTLRRQAGVRCGYQQPQRLGVDRWLAVIAAWNRFRTDCLVVDAGTAVTVDLVKASGRHVGGYIVPGAQLMADALARYTEKVRVDLVAEPTLSPGADTASAVNNGLLGMVIGLLVTAESQFGDGAAPLICLSGGGSDPIASGLEQLSYSGPITRSENLVLDGLEAIHGH